MSASVVLGDELLADLAALATAPRVLVALDFDGTLAPEVDRPDDARAVPEAHEALLRLLDAPETPVAMISGRALASLEHVTRLPEAALLVGSHGVEVRHDGTVELTLDDDERMRLARLHDALESVAARFDGAWVETKPAGFALHTRLVAPAEAEHAQVAARSSAAPEENRLTVRSGKNVLEFSVRSTTKGDAVRALRERTGADAVLFAGDDVTDEDGFAALRPVDLGIKVGAGATRAAHRVAGPAEMAAALEALAAARHRT
ncbi:trehalose-phosphatase [Herbiconiux moechotypicola]|uniref:Trehalose 6-phosphate phosphatase n=1 Tax=Herbiconiux moechotypicola TaxID=637393 RepID=A0ABN3DU56_9MICO|nr:trehalose-phosphatase [Herbiconiux moechotypicola]MCS5731068.1 trehalose-phosphatase [Herbiconiux moechotypicola]